MRKQRRRCGGGCGQPLRSGSSRRAYVTTIAGGVAHATVCHRCAARGVLFVVFLDEPSLQGPARRTKTRTRPPSNWFDDEPPAERPNVGTMSREHLEAEAVPLLQDGADIAAHLNRARERAEVQAMSRNALEARVVVLRAQRASSSGTVRAPKVAP